MSFTRTFVYGIFVKDRERVWDFPGVFRDEEAARFKTLEDARNDQNPVFPGLLVGNRIELNPEWDAAEHMKVYSDRELSPTQ